MEHIFIKELIIFFKIASLDVNLKFSGIEKIEDEAE